MNGCCVASKKSHELGKLPLTPAFTGNSVCSVVCVPQEPVDKPKRTPDLRRKGAGSTFTREASRLSPDGTWTLHAHTLWGWGQRR